jgi:hypothetical protein
MLASLINTWFIYTAGGTDSPLGRVAEKIGHGGTEYMAMVSGMNVNTIRKGRGELAENLNNRPPDRGHFGISRT